MYKTGTCSADGVTRKDKRTAHSFVAVPWGARAKGYLPGIKTLSLHKWREFVGEDTEGDESKDSRGLLIHVSDDSADEASEAAQVEDRTPEELEDKGEGICRRKQ
ncbi:hypothetical protein B0H14DRAFT_2575355 [Mycena olivaceomarginata]|nr:hypothetical protein B0H14DRAFT_2575355 [Mycena olivaceomarginata]